MPNVPRLQLTHGQVAWSICGGRPPDPRTLDSLRYLRQLGVPFTLEERGSGRGNRLAYSFNHLIECAIAMYAIRRGAKPRLVAPFLVGDRVSLRKSYREMVRSLPELAYDQPWVKSRGAVTPTHDDEVFIRVHERYADASGKIEMMTIDEVVSFKAGLGDVVERYDSQVYALVPLKRVMIETLAWARIAPVTPPGKPPRRPPQP